jgi:hypothetical protein
VVNFDGPIRLLRGLRYHGGAFVVFSKTLNDVMEVMAVEGSFASVIGGAPAAGVVFAARWTRGPVPIRGCGPWSGAWRVRDDVERARLRTELTELRAAVRSEKSARSRPSSTPCTRSSGR